MTASNFSCYVLLVALEKAMVLIRREFEEREIIDGSFFVMRSPRPFKCRLHPP